MAEQANRFRDYLRAVLRPTDPTADADLLCHFISSRSGDAFASLVHRHGSMVWGVCRRVLRCHADAEDAFQATFLVLARRAAAVRPASNLANWLHGVAYRTALEARRAMAVRRIKEKRAAERNGANSQTTGDTALREVLDQELATLPERYRAAVVLCELEGLTRTEAAARLGWSEGEVAGRLTRGRAMLARRLSKHGLVSATAGLGLVSGSAIAGVPGELLRSTVQIGVLTTAHGVASVTPAAVVVLFEGVMKAMLLTKLKGLATAVVIASAVLVSAAAGWQANTAGAADTQAAGEYQGRAARDPDKDRIAQLEKERDELLKIVRELKERLAKVEAAQDKNDANKLLSREKALLERAHAEEQLRLSLKSAGEERPKVARGTPSKVTEGGLPVDLADKLRLMELDRLRTSNDPFQKTLQKYQAEMSALAAKMKQLEAERAKAEGDYSSKQLEKAKEALEGASSKLKKQEVERARAAAGSALKAADRSAVLEDRVKQLERDLEKLMVEVERLRKK